MCARAQRRFAQASRSARPVNTADLGIFGIHLSCYFVSISRIRAISVRRLFGKAKKFLPRYLLYYRTSGDYDYAPAVPPSEPAEFPVFNPAWHARGTGARVDQYPHPTISTPFSITYEAVGVCWQSWQVTLKADVGESTHLAGLFGLIIDSHPAVLTGWVFGFLSQFGKPHNPCTAGIGFVPPIHPDQPSRSKCQFFLFCRGSQSNPMPSASFEKPLFLRRRR